MIQTAPRTLTTAVVSMFAGGLALGFAGAAHAGPKAAQAKPTPRLLSAYQEEVAYLTEERRSLDVLKSRLEKDLDQARRELREKRAKLSAELSRLRRESGALERSMVLLEDQAVQREAVMSQLNTLVGDAPGDTTAARLTASVRAATAEIRDMSAVTRAPGRFFSLEGNEVKGDIVAVGGVAAFGIHDGHAFVLTPAGGGPLKASSEIALDTAEKLARGQAVGTTGLLLWPDKNTAFTPRAEKSFMDTLRAAGPIGAVIVTLFFLSVLLIVLRAFLLLGAARKVDRFRFDIVEAALARNLEACRAYCEQHPLLQRAVGPVLDAAHLDWDAREDIASEGVLAASETLERFSTVILVIAAVAPLLGLLGTVTGMISTFDSITAFGTGDPRVLSGGISEALITTELGLIVAITSLFLGQVLAAYGARTLSRLESCALSVAHGLATGPVQVVSSPPDVRRRNTTRSPAPTAAPKEAMGA